MQNGKACHRCARAEQHRWLRGQRKRWAPALYIQQSLAALQSLTLKLAERNISVIWHYGMYSIIIISALSLKVWICLVF